MVTERFKVENEFRLIHYQKFIKENMPTCRFIYTDKQKNGNIDIELTYEIEDINKIGTVHNYYHDLDNPKIEKKNFFDKWKSYIKNLAINVNTLKDNPYK